MNNINMSPKKSRQRVKIWARISVPILLMVVLQILTYSAVLIFGGEFRNIREYAYSTLVEKTENRSTYIRNDLRQKPVFVQEYAEQINRMVDEILAERGASIADLQTNKDLDRSIIESSANLVVGLLRRSLVNDAYLILEPGDLYADEGGDNAKAALYLQDLDPTSGSGYDDLLMGAGFASISQEFGITRHSGWSAYFMPDPEDTENFDFYYRILQTERENSGLSQNYLGYWSGFSRLSSVSTPSMKYSMPLIAQDGTIYGVLGIGLMESAIVSNLSANDILNETACYVLGHSTSDNSYNILTHSGSSYADLLGSPNTLYIGDKLDTNEEIYGLDMDTDTDLLCSVQYMDLYNQNSPYAEEQWALISVADKEDVLQPVSLLSRMLVVSAAVSLAVAAVVAIMSCTSLIRPISAAIKQMKTKRKFNEVIHFQPSNIYEIDEMTDAITQLQINVRSFSSQVSKMISIADVGLGTFMYDRTDDSVFVGQSLIKILRLSLPQGEDIVMSWQEFLNSIKNPEIRLLIEEGLKTAESGMREGFNEVYRVNRLSGGTLWLRLGYTFSQNTAIGIVQDITDTMVEKHRIEHERDYDILTGLLNRQAYYHHVENLFHDRNELKITAFVMVDLDNLKYVNDTYGHAFGDDYLQTAASVLKKFQDYGGIVSRLSGDEFSICLPSFSSKEEVRAIIARVHSELMQSSCLLADGTHFNVSGSMGVSWYPDDAESRELLMKYADFAMYTIKHSTKGGVAEFDMSSYSGDSDLLTDVDEMNRIIEERGVKYAFQSIISAKTGEVYGYEALMRVQSEIFQSPLELLQTAKASTKLYEIERLTWTKALADFHALIEAGRIEETAHIFINSIANCELNNSDMQLIEASHANLMPQVVLDIPENENATNPFTAHKKAYLKKWSAQIALDDFGIGYNSESTLLSIQPNIIKIDRSITKGCDKDPRRRMIISNLVKLARTKQILVAAEGVETEEEMKTVISCGVDLLQGYYFGQPLFEPHPLAPAIADMIQHLANPGNEQKDGD